MKKQHFLFGAIAVLCLGLPWSSSIAGSKSYPMVCRGGGNMTAMYGRGADETVLNITFERSPHADNKQHPGPGQCAWLDRPLSPEEKLDLTYKSEKNKITNLRIKTGVVRIERYEGNDGGRNLKYLIDAIHNGQLFNVHATRAKTPWGSPYLKITRVGP